MLFSKSLAQRAVKSSMPHFFFSSSTSGNKSNLPLAPLLFESSIDQKQSLFFDTPIRSNGAAEWAPNWKFYETPFSNHSEGPSFNYSRTASWSQTKTSPGWQSLTPVQKAAGSCAILGLAATVLENMTHNGTQEDSMGPVARSLFRQTYLYTLGGTALAVGTAYGAIKTGLMMRYLKFVSRSPMIGLAASLGPFLISSIAMRSTNDPVLKHAAAFSLYASIGFSASPLILLGIPALTEAAILTGGIFTALSGAAILSPNDAFANWGGALTIGLVTVALSSFIPMFIRRPGKGTAIMHKISMYGGLGLFSAFLLYDTNRIQQACKASEYANGYGYSPLEGSVRIFLDLYNIFVRLASIAAGSKRK